MKRATVVSFGIIPVHPSPDGMKVLLVEQYGADGTHWGFPKGQAVPGESPTDTAERELREEVGIRLHKRIEGISFKQHYSFTFDETIVDKSVEYYIGLVKVPGFALQEKEIKDASWFNFTDARNRITFMSTKRILDDALEYIEENTDEIYL